MATRTIHTHRCTGALPSGPCAARVQCAGPVERDEDGGCGGYCPGEDGTLCEDCQLAIANGQRCDNCGVLGDTVWPSTTDRYCPPCMPPNQVIDPRVSDRALDMLDILERLVEFHDENSAPPDEVDWVREARSIVRELEAVR